jgi:hypothetical protein
MKKFLKEGSKEKKTEPKQNEHPPESVAVDAKPAKAEAPAQPEKKKKFSFFSESSSGPKADKKSILSLFSESEENKPKIEKKKLRGFFKESDSPKPEHNHSDAKEHGEAKGAMEEKK